MFTCDQSNRMVNIDLGGSDNSRVGSLSDLDSRMSGPTKESRG